MNVHVDIRTLSQKLEKRIKARGLKLLKTKAVKLIADVHKVAKDWKISIRSKLMKPAVSRGYMHSTSKWLKPHDNANMNDSFPMRVSGDLRDAVRYRVTQRYNKDSIVISVNRWIEPTLRNGFDYGEALNTTHPILQGWKDRAFDKLDSKLRSLV